MSNPSRPHDDADALARQLDQRLPPGEARAGAASDDDPRVRAAWELARGPHPALDDDAAARIEARLLAAARLLYAEHPVLDEPAVARGEARMMAHRRPRRTVAVSHRWTRALARIAAVLVVLVVALYGTVMASADSLPGEALYPVKRLVERGEIALASEREALDLRLRFADRRLDEFEQLLARGDVRPGVLHSAVAELEAALTLVEQGVGTTEVVSDEVRALAARRVVLGQAVGSRAQLDDRSEVVRIVRKATRAAAHSRRARADEAQRDESGPVSAPAVPAWQARILPPGLVGNPHAASHAGGGAASGDTTDSDGRGPDGEGPPGQAKDKPSDGAAPPGPDGEGPPGQTKDKNDPPGQSKKPDDTGKP